MFSFHWERSQFLILPKTQFPPRSYFPNAWTGEHVTAPPGLPGLYLSALQSSLGAAALFALFVFPVLNYASEALPISSEGGKKRFFKNLTSSFVTTAPLGERLHFYPSIHPPIHPTLRLSSYPWLTASASPLQDATFHLMHKGSVWLQADTGSQPGPAMAEVKEKQPNPRSPHSQENPLSFSGSFSIAKVFTYLI